MLQLLPQAFQGPHDVAQMIALAQAAVADTTRPCYFHPGDIYWRLTRNTLADPSRSIYLWRGEDERLLGFAWFDPFPIVFLQVDPQLQGSARQHLEEQMLHWSLKVARIQSQSLAKNDQNRVLWTDAFEDDVERIDLLDRLGFQREEDCAYLMQRELALPIPDFPESLAAAGWSVRSVSDEHSFSERVATHLDAWHPSTFTLKAYQQVRATPGYRSDLDLVLVSPDGHFVASCLCWLDETNGVGLFEPVGTRLDWRGQGFGKRIVEAGLRRLRDLGATRAITTSLGENEASTRLYTSTGFTILRKDWAYRINL